MNKRTLTIWSFFLLLSAPIFGQKFGHINSNELLLAMPERATIEQEIKAYAQDLEKVMLEMQAELESKYQKFQAEEPNMTEPIKEARYKDLTDLDQRIKDYQTSASEDLAKKEKELTDPLILKARTAIEDVAKENGFTYIFDNSAGFLLYSGGGEDVTALVRKKLGLE